MSQEKTVRVNMTMPKELKDEVKAYAKSIGVDVSSLVRMLLISELKNPTKK